MFDPVGGADGAALTPYKANDTIRRNFILGVCGVSPWPAQHGTAPCRAVSFSPRNLLQTTPPSPPSPSGNYNTLSCVDTDDGSCYFDVVGNVLMGGQIGMKGWQQGHDVAFRDNLHTWPQGPWPQMAQSGYGGPLNSVLEGHEYVYTGNTCVLSFFGAIPRAWIGTEGMCFPNATGRAVTANNTLFWDSRDTNVTECGEWTSQMLLATFQRDYGGDPGTVAAPYNATSEPGMAEHLIGIARAKLFA